MDQNVRHQGIRTESANASFYLNSTLTSIRDIGKPVSLDPAANYTVGLSQDGDDILGFLESFEERSQEGYNFGAVAPKIYTDFEYTGTTPVIGQWVVGAGDGKVKGTIERSRALVEAVDVDNKIVSVTFM